MPLRFWEPQPVSSSGCSQQLFSLLAFFWQSLLLFFQSQSCPQAVSCSPAQFQLFSLRSLGFVSVSFLVVERVAPFFFTLSGCFSQSVGSQ